MQGCEAVGIGIGDNHIRVSPFCQVFGKNVGAGADWFVGHEQGIVGQQRAPQGALAAGRGAEVEHAARREVYLLESLGYEHRRGLLHVVSPGVEQGIGSELRSLREVKAVGAPWHGLRNGQSRLRGGSAFEGIEPDAYGRGLIVERGEQPRAPFGAEQAGDVFLKGNGEHLETVFCPVGRVGAAPTAVCHAFQQDVFYCQG